jgi:hypothetical protein
MEETHERAEGFRRLAALALPLRQMLLRLLVAT